MYNFKPNDLCHTFCPGIRGNGFDVEIEFFGNGRPRREPHEIPYEEYFTALRGIVKNPGIWNPRHPNTPLARCLMSATKKAIRIGIPWLSQHSLYIYSSLNTSFDVHHGVDAFCLLKFRGKSCVVTLDVSLAMKSKDPAHPLYETLKADVLIHVYKKYAKPTIDKAATDIANLFRLFIESKRTESMLYI